MPEKNKRLSHILSESAQNLDSKAGEFITKRNEYEKLGELKYFPREMLLTNGEFFLEFGSQLLELGARSSYSIENKLCGKPSYEPVWIHKNYS